jgi:excisionase family DNA binding protein
MPPTSNPKHALGPDAETGTETASSPPGEVLTLAEAATYLRLPESGVFGLVHSLGLPGRFTGSEWRFLRGAIQDWLRTGLPTTPTRKEAQLALAGKYKDDPNLQQICQDAYRKRGRPITED